MAQGRLAIPGVELSYVSASTALPTCFPSLTPILATQIYGLLQRTPGWSLQQKTIPRIDKLLAELDASTPESYGSGQEYWDGKPHLQVELPVL